METNPVAWSAARWPKAKALRLLVLERDAVLRRTLLRVLRSLFLEVQGVAAFEDAVVELTKHPFDAVVLSWGSTREGQKLCAGLRARAANVPIVAVTQQEDARAQSVAFGAGVDVCVTRSLDAKELCARVERGVGTRRKRPTSDRGTPRPRRPSRPHLRRPAAALARPEPLPTILAAPAASPLASLLQLLNRVVNAESMPDVLGLLRDRQPPIGTVIVDEDFGPPERAAELRRARFAGTLIYVTHTRARRLQDAACEAGANLALSREDMRHIIELLLPSAGAAAPRQPTRLQEPELTVMGPRLPDVQLAGGLILDCRTGQVQGPAGIVQLTEKQTELLLHLLEKDGTPISAAELANRLWKRTDDRGPNLVHKHVSNTRAKLRETTADVSYDPFDLLPKGYRLRVE